MTMTTQKFYDQMSSLYHLLFWQGFDASIKKHGNWIDQIICREWGNHVLDVLDISCGIGTQSLGLAGLGYSVTASDLSPAAIARAKDEAAQRELVINFRAGDMRQAYDLHQGQFDLVLSTDNSVPHLLTDDDILTAFHQFYQCCKPGGGCLISVRDYEAEGREDGKLIPHGVRQEGDKRYFIFQVRDYEGDQYTVSMYFVEDDGSSPPKTHVMRAKYYAVEIEKLMDLLELAGFQDVRRLDEGYFQPVIIGTRRKLAKKGVVLKVDPK